MSLGPHVRLAAKAVEARPRTRGAAAGWVRSESTGEWMYVFKPTVAGAVVYLKLMLRESCLVVFFHEDEGDSHEEGP